MEKTRKIMVGNIPIGGGAPVSVQSMTNTKTEDSEATSAQIAALAKAGCEIVRVTVPNSEAVGSLPGITEKSSIPIIADIHFDHNLAIGAINAGVHGVRINPGNIKSEKHVAQLAEIAGDNAVPIRVGANSGSVSPVLLAQKEIACRDPRTAIAQTLVESALQQCEILERSGFRDIKVSLKSSDVKTTVLAYRTLSQQSDYPLHLGVTEAGTPGYGTIKSAIGIGALLLDDIGDTIRVSLSADPIEEVKTAIMILESLGIRKREPEIISCPTCGRTDTSLFFRLLRTVETIISEIKNSGGKIRVQKLAVMGCVVNGPGEAMDSDLAICLGENRGKVILYKHGERIGFFREDEVVKKLKEELSLSRPLI